MAPRITIKKSAAKGTSAADYPKASKENICPSPSPPDASVIPSSKCNQSTTADSVEDDDADEWVDMKPEDFTQTQDVEQSSTQVLSVEQSTAQLQARIDAFTPMSESEVIAAYPEQESITRDRFLEGGIYEHLYKMLIDAKGVVEKRPKMMATAELDKDFLLSRPSPSAILCARKDGTIATFTCFGEIASAFEGTRLSARGNHFSATNGDNFQFLRDDSAVKNILILRSPTIAPPAITQLFIEQVCLLEEIITAVEMTEGPGWESIKWSRSTHGKDGLVNAIAVSTPRIYAMPPSTSIAREAKTRIVRRMGGTSENKATELPKGDQIHPDALYDPSVLPDYGGPYFQLRRARLAQQKFYDMDDELIPPWTAYDTLRPGTLVAVNVSLECFVRTDTKKKYYQAKLHKLSVIAESSEPMEKRNLPAVPMQVKAKERIVEAPVGLDDFRVSRKRKANSSV